jgi:hypothetical protein
VVREVRSVSSSKLGGEDGLNSLSGITCAGFVPFSMGLNVVAESILICAKEREEGTGRAFGLGQAILTSHTALNAFNFHKESRDLTVRTVSHQALTFLEYPSNIPTFCMRQACEEGCLEHAALENHVQRKSAKVGYWQRLMTSVLLDDQRYVCFRTAIWNSARIVQSCTCT